MSNENKFDHGKYSRPICQLDRVLVNKIAAGEVIERPASVVKELVENSFDAGASNIEITARKAGTTFISVVDNGCGIKSEQVRLAFSRHATSKISNLDDLFAVSSYGFRGEALPSIASVSHLTLTTRHFSESAGSRVVIEGGNEVDFRPAAAPAGTKIEVAQLFFNTPARRKFLKSEVTESRQIVRVTERMALSKPSVGIRLNLNDRETFALPEGQAIDERMSQLFKIDRDKIVDYDIEFDGISYRVYLTHPDLARQDRTRVCLFINGRSVTSSSLVHGITSGYGEFLPGGRFPSACAYITLDPDRLDVNVHPTKAEVRLAEDRAIHDNLYRIVKKALRDWRMVPSRTYRGGGDAQRHSGFRQNDQASASLPLRPANVDWSKKQYPATGGRDYSPGVRKNTSIPASIETEIACDNSKPAKDKPHAGPPPVAEVSPDEINFLGKTGKTYLVVTIRGELYVIDQHAAHERVLYEEALKTVAAGSSSSQKLLFPETVELTADEFITFENSREVLTKLGFEVEPFGGHSIIINGMPPVFGDKNPNRILKKLIDDIGQLNKAGGELIKSVAQSHACRAAVMAGDRLSGAEVSGLVARLLEANNPYCCPHGRPTFIKISRDELDSRFGRK